MSHSHRLKKLPNRSRSLSLLGFSRRLGASWMGQAVDALRAVVMPLISWIRKIMGCVRGYWVRRPAHCSMIGRCVHFAPHCRLNTSCATCSVFRRGNRSNPACGFLHERKWCRWLLKMEWTMSADYSDLYWNWFDLQAFIFSLCCVSLVQVYSLCVY